MIRPLGRNVTARIPDAGKVTKSGIYIPESTAEMLAPKVADILAVGDEVTKVKPGDQVVFKPYATYEMKLESEDYVMLEEEDILGVLTDDKRAAN